MIIHAQKAFHLLNKFCRRQTERLPALPDGTSVEDIGDRIRLFLAEASYQKAQDNQDGHFIHILNHANVAQGLPELIEIASKKRYKENLKEKHDFDAKYGWYRYDTKFALPVYNENQELERFNVFQAVLLIRHAQDGKLYLYDLVNIKKETGKPLEQ